MYRVLSLRFLILVLTCLSLESSFSSLSYSLNGRIDFLYLLILDYAYFERGGRIPFFAMGMGLLRDLTGGHLPGIGTLALTLTGVLLFLGIQKLKRDYFPVQMTISFFFVAMTEALSLAIAILVGVNSKDLPTYSLHLAGSVFWTSLYTVIVSPVFFGFTHFWFKRSAALKQYELF